MPGTLFVIATPLGNLDDLSPRARETLGSVAWIACEDTRRTARLLERFGIDTPTLSCHRFNERARLDAVLARLAAGDAVALVSDGGTPGVSDPGNLLVGAARAAGFDVRPVPGPSAAPTLLSVSGLPADRYVFDGFLPHRAGERRRRLRELARESRPVVVFESPHRIVETLRDIETVLGERPLIVGRELTKLHETILRGSAREIAVALGDSPRGELTLILAPASGGSVQADTQPRRRARDLAPHSRRVRRRPPRRAAPCRHGVGHEARRALPPAHRARRVRSLSGGLDWAVELEPELSKKKKTGPGVLANNRAASHEYHLLRRLEAGIVLSGAEVKSAREGRVNLKGSYVRIRRHEAFLHDAHFSPYSHAPSDDYDPVRARKLLLHAREILKLERETVSSGTTLVPTRLYLKNGRIKLEIALARGKKAHDKRESTRKREVEREMAREKGSRTVG